MIRPLFQVSSVIICILALSTVTLARDNPLMVPLPPDATLYPSGECPQGKGIPQSGFTQAFYTPHSVEDIVAFYSDHVGEMNIQDEGLHYRAGLMEVEVKSLGILKVYDFPRDPGVSVKDIRALAPRNCTGKYLRPFREMYRALEAYDRQDYRDLCERFGYLENAYFGLSDQSGNDGKLRTKDEVLHREYQRRLDEEAAETLTAEDMMEEAQRLMSEGKMDEAAALMEEMATKQQSAMQRDMDRVQGMEEKTVDDHWDEWLVFLNELEKLAFPTVVYIDYHPSHWPDDEWLQENIDW